MKTVVGLFDNITQAQHAVSALEAADISHNDISVITNNQNSHYGMSSTGADAVVPGSDNDPTAEAGRGALAGGITGFLVGLAPFVIPGLGPIAAVGWLASTLVGAGIGATVGVVGALNHAGIPEEDAAYYSEGVRRGGTLVVVKTPDEMADRASRIMDDAGAININERSEQYRREGFQPNQAFTTPPSGVGAPVVVNAVQPVVPVSSARPVAPVSSPEPWAGRHVGRSSDFSAYNDAFRADFRRNYALMGAAYEQYEPAYRYGYDLANNQQYRGRDWALIEPQIRQDWERTYPNSWERFKISIRYAWDEATGAERGGIQTGGRALDGTPDTRGVTEKMADALTGDRIDDKTGKIVR